MLSVVPILIMGNGEEIGMMIFHLMPFQPCFSFLHESSQKFLQTNEGQWRSLPLKFLIELLLNFLNVCRMLSVNVYYKVV